MNKQNRRLEQTFDGRLTSDGAGVKLRRIINPQPHHFDPFLLFDEFKSDAAADYIGGFPDHPHRGFETVTYMIEGAILHRDHLGNEGHLRKGDVQWMTAAHGIIHSEFPEQENGLLHGFQLWLNLPAKEKMKAPDYQDIASKNIPHIPLANDGYLKLIAGHYLNNAVQYSGVIKGITTEPVLIDVSLSPNQTVDIPVPSQHMALLYIYQGKLHIEPDGKILKAGQLGQLSKGDNIHLATREQAAKVIVMAALPLHEPVVQSGPFVMNTAEEIEQAYRDYRDGVLTQCSTTTC